MCFRHPRQHLQNDFWQKIGNFFCEFWLLLSFCLLVMVFPEALVEGDVELSHSCCFWGSPLPILLQYCFWPQLFIPSDADFSFPFWCLAVQLRNWPVWKVKAGRNVIYAEYCSGKVDSDLVFVSSTQPFFLYIGYICFGGERWELLETCLRKGLLETCLRNIQNRLGLFRVTPTVGS